MRRGKGFYQVAFSGLSSFPGKTMYTLSRGKGHCGGLCKSCTCNWSACTSHSLSGNWHDIQMSGSLPIVASHSLWLLWILLHFDSWWISRSYFCFGAFRFGPRLSWLLDKSFRILRGGIQLTAWGVPTEYVWYLGIVSRASVAFKPEYCRCP